MAMVCTIYWWCLFFDNNWHSLPAKMIVDDNHHPVTRHMPDKFIASINEWYGWKPNPGINKNVKVLVTLDPALYRGQARKRA